MAIAAAACTALLYEILVVRITSAILLYHFTFLALSLAMLGLGAPGVWYSVFAPNRRALGVSLLAAAVSIPLSVAAIFKLGVYLTKGEGVVLTGLPMLVMVAALIPMLALGSAICVLLIEASGRHVGRMYAADLTGASVGALCVIPLMKLFDTPLILACIGLLPALAAAIVAPRLRTAACVTALAIVGSVVWKEPYVLRYNRVYVETEAPLFERWTPTGRITVRAKDPRLERYVLGASLLGPGSRYQAVPRDHLWVLQEGGAGTTITHLPDSPAMLDYLAYDVTSVGYQIWQPRRACVIGSGGGRDVLTALHFGAKRVTAVEIHGEIIDALRGRFRDYSGHLYDRPDVRTVVAEGRSFLEHTNERYDLLQISLVDSWAATAAGAFALAENHLYTTEAFRRYWSRLTDRGVISVTRFYTPDLVTEAIRLAYLALDALEREGVAEPLRHIMAVNATNKFTLLVSKQPISGPQVAALEAVAVERGFIQLFPRGATTPTTRSTFTDAVMFDPRPANALGRDLTPPTDDRPYFFQSASFLSGLSDLGPATEFNERAVLLLRFLLEVLTLFSLAFFFLPFLLRRRLPRGRNFARGTAYFACIGLGFMFVETSLIQRFILYLGHPSYAVTVVLAAILLCAGLGAAITEHAPERHAERWVLAMPVLAATVSGVLSQLVPVTLGAPFAVRVAICLALLAPLGLAAGTCLPSGMIRFGDRSRAWFWAVNGAMSVLGSVLAIVLSMMAGFSAVTVLGAVLYLAGYLLLRSTRPEPVDVQ